MKIWGVTGWKNAGKTGLVERLVSEFTDRGLKVATVKHVHAGFDIDKPGTDSARHRDAGAREVLISSRTRWALIHELAETEEEPKLDVLLAQLAPTDLVLVEGFKNEAHPKIEAHRAITEHPLIAPNNPTIRAIASDSELDTGHCLRFDLNDTKAIADFIAGELDL